MVRYKIDAIDEHGIIDHDFSETSEYTSLVKSLKAYLKAEGFDDKAEDLTNQTEEFTIKFLKRSWRVKPIKFKT